MVTACNQIVGFKDVKLEGDAGNGSGSDGSTDGPAKHACSDGIDNDGDNKTDFPADPGCTSATDDDETDPPPQNLFVFVTDAGFIGGFGAANGARQTADIKCQDKYTASFSTLGCTQIHAFIQIDDTVDSLARFKITFNTIPLASEVKRATDMTPVSAKFDDFVNPNLALSAPIAPGTAQPFFWSGRGAGANLQCNNWTSSQMAVQGNAGDVTKVNAWTTQANIACNNFDEHFVCVCW